MALRKRNAAVLLKLEASEGVPETPSASVDAILVENPQLTVDPNLIATDEVTGSLDGRGSIVGGIKGAISFDVYCKGSGTPATPPEFGDALKACGWAETITAAAVPAAPEACAAGGSTTLAVLGASASATAQIYRGMPINFTGAVTLSSFIADYTAAKNALLADTASGAIIATTSYQIPINVRYGPASGVIPSATIEYYEDGVKYVLAGMRGTLTGTWTAGGALKLSFRFTGMFVSKTDVAVPVCTYDATRPPIWKGGVSKINRVAAACRQMTLDMGNQLPYPDNPNAAQGFDPTIITRRALTGSIDPAATLVATRNLLADLQAGTQRIIHGKMGIVAGNSFGLTIPAGLITADNPGDRDGVAAEQVNFECVGQDAGAFLCFY